MSLLATVAMALDTLPTFGRLMLLAWLLTLLLFGFTRLLPAQMGSSLQVLYRKGAMLALLGVPLGVYLINIQVPVPVDEVVSFNTPVPTYVVTVLLGLWVLGVIYQLSRVIRQISTTLAHAARATDAHSKIVSRCTHWQKRLAYERPIKVVCGGSEQAWHAVKPWFGVQPAVICLPAAAANWPAGLVDAMLLNQLAQLKQGSWRWLVFAQVVQALYWPAPWVSQLVQQLALHLVEPAERLAASAYRDNEGWSRDVRNLAKRTDLLQDIPALVTDGLLRLPSDGIKWLPPRPQLQSVRVDGLVFEDQWASSKRRKKDKHRDPYEQAYWLIAVASIVVGVSTTLTLVPRAPEFQPQYLNVKWQDQMVRRVYDDFTKVKAPAETGEPRGDNAPLASKRP
jgi:hypothetical protein